MFSNHWRYINPTLKIQINKISSLFSGETIKEEGSVNKGKITFYSTHSADEIWGPEAYVEVSWESFNPEHYHHGLKVKETITMFSSINVVARRKETKWHLSHEMTYWYGTRQQIMHKRFYPSEIIHGLLLCEITRRLFQFHAVVISNVFPTYEKAILDIMDSLQCHGE